jgi:hypothetical protein
MKRKGGAGPPFPAILAAADPRVAGAVHQDVAAPVLDVAIARVEWAARRGDGGASDAADNGADGSADDRAGCNAGRRAGGLLRGRAGDDGQRDGKSCNQELHRGFLLATEVNVVRVRRFNALFGETPALAVRLAGAACRTSVFPRPFLVA